jgi:predicted DCC family thiol-disulfide oxidoreductase YuxK
MVEAMPPVSESPSPAPPVVVYFDGVCGLCNRFVDLLLRQDRKGRLLFAPLQGETARARLPGLLSAGLDTVVLVDASGTHTRSEAILRTLTALGGLWRLAGLLRLVPRGWRDGLYDAITRRRYRWFGKRPDCRLPTAEERTRFLP